MSQQRIINLLQRRTTVLHTSSPTLQLISPFTTVDFFKKNCTRCQRQFPPMNLVMGISSCLGAAAAVYCIIVVPQLHCCLLLFKLQHCFHWCYGDILFPQLRVWKREHFVSCQINPIKEQPSLICRIQSERKSSTMKELYYREMTQKVQKEL